MPSSLFIRLRFESRAVKVKRSSWINHGPRVAGHGPPEFGTQLHFARNWLARLFEW